jgi:uncharacterized protein (DUF58 family)
LLTRDNIELIVTAVTFMVLGMFLGNLILITLGLAPLIFLAIGVLIEKPKITSAERIGKDLKINVDDKIADHITVTINGGPGIVTAADILPKTFALTDGTNFKAFWKGLAPKQIEFGYMAICSKRGAYDLQNISWEIRQPLQIRENELGVSQSKRTIIVQPQPLYVKKVREQRSLSRIPMPMDARFRFGIPTTDFSEIRNYSPGDSYRKINWKASAKRLSRRPGEFLVNEYEKEGKKVVWIFLDSSTRMALGTTINNTMEYAIRATLGFTNFYLDRDCKVGFCVYDNDAYQWEGPFQEKELEIIVGELKGLYQLEDPASLEPLEAKKQWYKSESRVLFPDIGRRQQYKITKELLYVDIKYSSESLKEAIHSNRSYIAGTSPLFIIITMIESTKIRGIIEGIKELHKYLGRYAIKSNIILFNVQGYQVAATTQQEKIGAELLNYLSKPYFEFLRKLGCFVVNWDPIEESFAQALQRQRVTK